MSLIEKIDAEMQTINSTDVWEVKLMKDEFNRALLIAKEIILSDQKEPCKGCQHENSHVSTYPCNMCPRAYTDKYQPINQSIRQVRYS